MRRLFVLVALFAGATAVSGEPKPKVAADPAAEAIVSYRQAEMMAAAKVFKAMSIIAKGEVTRPKGEFVQHAEALHNLAGDLVSQFPAGTEHGKVKSEARAEIWSDAAGFAAASTAFEEATAKVLAAAKADDAQGVKDGMSAIGQSCGGCHEKYRLED